jgi:RNA binding exosome subunit
MVNEHWGDKINIIITAIHSVKGFSQLYLSALEKIEREYLSKMGVSRIDALDIGLL